MIGRLNVLTRRARYSSFLMAGSSALMLGCGAAPTPANPPPPPPAASAAPPATPPSASASAEEVAPSPPPPVLTELEPHFAPSADLNLEFEFPVVGQLIPSAKAAKYKIHLQLDGQPKGKRYRVALRLDDNQPHVVDLKSPVELGSLLDADAELGQGAHVLFAIALDEAGEPWLSKPEWSRGPSAIVRFGIDSREVTAGPLVRVLSPSGTFNGEASVKDARLNFTVNPPLGRGSAAAARVVISGEHGEKLERVVKEARPCAVSGLQNGDYRFEVQLLGSDGKPLDTPGAVDAQTITVNLDAPK
ncbi:MAG: hypothetical protein R3B07_16470 [Polyangiaceae bacterium]